MVGEMKYKCDRCEVEVPEGRLYVTVDRRMNGAGSSENDEKNFDLCRDCCYDGLKLLLKDLPYIKRQEFIREFMSQRKKIK